MTRCRDNGNVSGASLGLDWQRRPATTAWSVASRSGLSKPTLGLRVQGGTRRLEPPCYCSGLGLLLCPLLEAFRPFQSMRGKGTSDDGQTKDSYFLVEFMAECILLGAFLRSSARFAPLFACSAVYNLRLRMFGVCKWWSGYE